MRRSNPRFCLVCNAVVFVLVLCGVGRAASGENEQSQTKPDTIAKPDGTHDAAFYFAEADRLYVEPPSGIDCDELPELRHLWPSELTEKRRSLLTEWVAKNGDALMQLRLAVQKAQDANPFKDADLSDASKRRLDMFRKLLGIAMFRAKFTAAERGLTTEVEEDMLLCHRLGCVLAQSASLIGHLVGITIQTWSADLVSDILARTPADATAMLRLQVSLERAATTSEDPMAAIIRDEKLFFVPPLVKAFEGTDPESKLKHDEATFLAVEADLTWEEMEALDLRFGRVVQDFDAAYAYCLRFLSMSPWQARAQGLDFRKDLDALTHKDPWIRLLVFNGPGVARLRAHCEATQNALTATLALLRYKREKGSLPDTLEGLVSAGFAARLPMDPYSDKPLGYRRTGTDFVLYSWGEDFDDDGGQHSDWGRDKAGGDHVFWPVQPSTAEN